MNDFHILRAINVLVKSDFFVGGVLEGVVEIAVLNGALVNRLDLFELSIKVDTLSSSGY